MVGGSDAPWWGVPAIAGGFLLLGGFLSFLFARWNESTKHERENKQEQVRQLVELGAQVTIAGNKLREIGQLSLTRSLKAFEPILLEKGGPALDEFTLAMARFRLVQPVSMNEETQNLVRYTVMLLIPPFAVQGQERTISEQRKATRDFTNALRVFQGHEPFEELDGDTTLLDKAERVLKVRADELKDDEVKSKAAEAGTKPSETKAD